MKNLIILTALLPVLLLTGFLVSGCGVILVPKDGEMLPGETETRKYDFSEFTRVDISSSLRYEVIHSDTYSVSITANKNVFDDIKVTQEGQTLIIGMEIPGAPWAIFKVNPSINVVITLPKLDGLRSSGATHGTISEFISADALDFTVSGASSIELVQISVGDVRFYVSGSSKVTGGIEANNMELKLSGASTVQLKGSSSNMVTDVSGSSNLRLSDLRVGNANITLSGASNGTIAVDGNLDARLSGSSRLVYVGDPTLGIVNVTGASTLKRK